MEEERSTAVEAQQDECEDYVVDVTTASSWYKNVSYDDAKIFIRTNIESAARSFIAIGYYLKLIRDGELYREEGHENIWDFAMAEYGIGKSTASRYMSMNDRFSLDGNSPIVDQKYKDFEKSKLQEMLSLTDEQLEQVTPQMKVQEIRSMRQPKEIPYFELEGQMDLETDFPEVLPEAPAVTQPTTIQTTMTLEEMMGGEKLGEPDEQPEVVATSQQEIPSMVLETAALPSESAAEKQHSGKCLHNPLYDCSLADEDKVIPGTGEDCTHCCCWECPKHGGCNIECYASIRRELLETDDDLEEISELTPDPPEYDREQLEHMIWVQEQQLECMGKDWKQNEPAVYTKHRMMLRAYEMLLQAQDVADQAPKVVAQPELSQLRNNDQRAAFIDNYESWPLWIETQETGERYYRYDLPDGTSFVVKTYHSMLYDYKAGIGMRRKEGYGANEQYILEPGRFFRDCSANRSAMIEKLKELQKGEK